jgi:prolyl oligopeptidase
VAETTHHVESAPGVRVPYTVIRKAGKVTTAGPVLLYAYGAYGASTLPGFNPRNLAWVEAGGVFVVAHIRGGGELGPRWHTEGRREKKRNGIVDYIAVARDLRRQGITGDFGIVANGGSLGAVVVATAAIEERELFAGVVLNAPVADLARYHLFGSILDSEIGDPRNPAELESMLAVSPYYLIRPNTNYPPFFILSAAQDGRTGAAHARKLAAALKGANPKTNVAYLRTDAAGGHFGLLDASERARRQADTLAFAWSVATARTSAAREAP